MKKTFSKLSINDALFIIHLRDKVITEQSDKTIVKTLHIEETLIKQLYEDSDCLSIHIKSETFSPSNTFCRILLTKINDFSSTSIQKRVSEILRDYQIFIYKEDAEEFIRDYVRRNIFLYEEKLRKITEEINFYIKETRKTYFKELN